MMPLTLNLFLILFFVLWTDGDGHPLDPLSPKEIRDTIKIIRKYQPNPHWMFSDVTLKEPKKSELYPCFILGGDSCTTEIEPNLIPRTTFSIIIHRKNRTLVEVVVNLGTKSVESWTVLPIKGLEPTLSGSGGMGRVFMRNKVVQERLSKYPNLNLSLVVPHVSRCAYCDKPQYGGIVLAQSFFYTRLSETDNYYGHPLGFLALGDMMEKEFLEIEELPIQRGFSTSDRSGEILLPDDSGNYDPSLFQYPKEPLKPIVIQQPEGTNFILKGNHLTWTNFDMHIGFNAREGLVLHHITYNDSSKIRPLIYRASVSEMFVPYADPRPPFHRKMPFDAGQYGLGFNAGGVGPIECLNSAAYLNFSIINMAGRVGHLSNAACVYEEDGGILWRKWDWASGRTVTVRDTRLVVTFIAVAGNYDYQIKWIFGLDASIRFEINLHGIVSSAMVTPGTIPTHGTLLSKTSMALFHQHNFVVRLDTDIDGKHNTASVLDIHSDDKDPILNPYGNGYHVKETILSTPLKSRTKCNADTGRSWKVSVPNHRENTVSRVPMGYRLIPENGQSLLIRKDSPLYPKAAFCEYNMWITPYVDWQLFAGGKYLNNSGLPEWVENDYPNADLENQDIVLWHVLSAVTHPPRIEDFPVMPQEARGFWFKPHNFFLRNPAMEHPPLTSEWTVTPEES